MTDLRIPKVIRIITDRNSFVGGVKIAVSLPRISILEREGKLSTARSGSPVNIHN